MAVRHDVEQCLQRRAGVFDRAVGEVLLCDPFVGFADVLHAVDERVEVLRFRCKNRLVEDLVRVVEDTTEEPPDEPLVDAVPQPVRRDRLSLVLDVLDRFEQLVTDEPGGIPFFGGHPRPDFRHQQTDVVVEAIARSDMAGGG